MANIHLKFDCPACGGQPMQGNTPDITTWYCDTCGIYYGLPEDLRKITSRMIQGKPAKVLPIQALRRYRRKVKMAAISEQKKGSEARAKQARKTDFTGRPFYTIPLLKGDISKCPYCRGRLTQTAQIRVISYNGELAAGSVDREVPSCNNCDAPFFTLEIWLDLLNRCKDRQFYVFDARLAMSKDHEIHLATFETKNRAEQLPPVPKRAGLPHELPKNYKTNPPNLSELKPGQYIFLYRHKCHCTSCQTLYQQDTIRNITALVNTEPGLTVKVNAQYCVGCGRYFMNKSSFQAYNKAYGGILGQFFDSDAGALLGDNIFESFKKDSVLSRHHYNVRKDTPIAVRQAILTEILDTREATKHEILELLDSFIRVHQYIHPEACQRWHEDILFVNQYCLHQQKVVTGLKFQQKDK